VIAAPRADAQLLAGAKVLEDILGVAASTPIDPRAPK
jgi:amidase